MKHSISLTLSIFLAIYINYNAKAQSQATFLEQPELYITPSNELTASINEITKANSQAAGIMQKSLSLGSLNGRHINYPISLTYRATGHQSTEYAGSVGEGWRLDNLGSISRVIRGIDDFSPEGYLNKPLKTNFSTLTNNDLTGILNYSMDSQPDIFFININGIKEEFYFDANGELVINSNAQIEIKKPDPANDDEIWEVLDGNGNHYFFGGSQAIEMANGNTSAWFISKIITTKKDIIQFSYAPSEDITLIKDSYRLTSLRNNASNLVSADIPYANHSIIYKKVYLRSISINSGTAESKCMFNYADGRGDTHQEDLILSDITFQKKSAEGNTLILQSINLEHVILTNGLWLRKIDFQSKDQETVRTIDFEYNNLRALPTKGLNRYGDYWGFINDLDISNNYDQIYYPALAYSADGTTYTPLEINTRSFNSSTFFKAGLLEKINHSNGKVEEFVFERHTLTNEPLGFAGGARLHAIITSDKNSSAKVKIYYDYEQPTLISKPVNFYEKQSWTGFTNNATLSGIVGIGNKAFNLKNDVLTTSSVLYKKVFIYEEGFGRTEHNYEILDGVNTTTNIAGESGSSIIFDDFELKRPIAFLKSTKSYSEEGSLLHETSNFYKTYAVSGAIPGFKISSNYAAIQQKGTGTTNGTALPPLTERAGFKSYSFQLKSFRIDSSATTTYENSKIAGITAEKINFNTKGYPSGTLQYVNGIARQRSKYFYPSDFFLLPYAKMMTNNMQKTLIHSEIEIFREGNWHIIQGIINGYSEVNFGENGEKTFINDKVYNFEIADAPASDVPLISNKNYKLNAITSFDKFLHPIEVAFVKSGTFNSYLYNSDGTHLIAEVNNAKVDDVFYTSFEENGISGSTKTGLKGHRNSYQLPGSFSPSAQNLELSYWKRTAQTDWEYVEQPFTSSTITVPTNTVIDEVRVMPADATMATYNYDERNNLITQTDYKNETSRFAYSPLDQQTAEWDADGNLLWTMEHNYAQLKPCEDATASPLNATIDAASDVVEVGESITVNVNSSGGCGEVYYSWYGIEQNGTEVSLGTTLDGEIEFEVFCTTYFTLKCTVSDEAGQESITVRKYYKVLPGEAADDLDKVSISIHNQATIQLNQKLQIVLYQSSGLKCGLSKIQWYKGTTSGSSYQLVDEGPNPDIFYTGPMSLKCVMTDSFGRKKEEVFIIIAKPQPNATN